MQKMNLVQFIGSNFVPNCDTSFEGCGENRVMVQRFNNNAVITTSLATSTYVLTVGEHKVASGTLTIGKGWRNVCRLATICEFIARKKKSIGAKLGMSPLSERGVVLQESRWANLASTHK